MAEILKAEEVLTPEQSKPRRPESTLARVAKYTGLRVITLFFTVVAGIYLTIMIANMGGYVDQLRMGQIREQAGIIFAGMAANNPAVTAMSQEERNAILEEQIQIEVRRQGLDKPFVVRSFTFLTNALTLNLGRAENLVSDSGSRMVKLIILERLPATLVLFATANVFLFALGVVMALGLSRNYGNWLDRLVVAMAPTSAAPGWFYGLFLILIFSALLGVLPYGGMVSAPPPATTLGYALSLMRHMILPLAAQVLSAIFLTIYTWRTFFLIYSSEDYVELARAKGLSENALQRQYVMRPTLPTIITSFALTLITLWTGAIILETVFNWPGLGRTFQAAATTFDTPTIMGFTVVYAYLLAVTVFLLDFIYALVDPRVKVGGSGARPQ